MDLPKFDLSWVRADKIIEQVYRMKSKDELIAEIERKFRSTPPPEMPDEVAKDVEFVEETGEFWSKDWDEIELCAFHQKNWLYQSMPPSFIPYFLGCYMSKSLRAMHFDHSSFDILLEGGENLRNSRKYSKPRLELLRSGLSAPQLETFKDYMSFRKQYVNDTEAACLKDMINAIG